MKKQIDRNIIMTAILAIVIIEGMAMYHGIDGYLLSIIIAIIAGLAGWTMPQLQLKGGSKHG